MKWFMGIVVAAFFLTGFFLCLLLTSGCTYSVIVNHTEGIAEDLVDENQSASPDVKTDINLPKLPTPPFGVDSRQGQRF
jgi:hypothetical protein